MTNRMSAENRRDLYYAYVADRLALRGTQEHQGIIHAQQDARAEGFKAGAESALKSMEQWCDMQGQSLGAVDGYDYNSGQEYAFRCTAIEAEKRRRALPEDKP